MKAFSTLAENSRLARMIKYISQLVMEEAVSTLKIAIQKPLILPKILNLNQLEEYIT
jgi:hypothetical protein